MVSYKKLYLQEKRKNEWIDKIPYRCPICNSQLAISGQEIICMKKECTYDKIVFDNLSLIMDYFYKEAQYDNELE